MPTGVDTQTLLIRDLDTVATMDAQDSVLRHASIWIAGGVIQQIGAPPLRLPDGAQVIDGRHAIAIPGLINTHHHLYQTLTRAYAPAADADLFNWLRTLYPIWARLDEESMYAAALAGMAELLLSGCTTTADHHYVFPRGQPKLIDAEIAAAQRIGIRFHVTRGSMSVGESEGGLPPDSLVETEEQVLADSERLVEKYHDPGIGSMLQVALAPCSPFSVSPRLLRETADLASRHAVGLHTHLAETRDEEKYCLEHFRKRPFDLLEDAGWINPGTWLAHGIYFNRREIARLGRMGVGIAHCPTSNMRLGSGCAPVGLLSRAGCPVGLGVDGSASNDSSHMLAEARQALLLQRLKHGASSLAVRDALRMATAHGAACLGRTDIGSLETGKCADIAMFDLRQAGYSGAGDAVCALLLCAPARVSTLIVAGREVVEKGELMTTPLEPMLVCHRKCAARLMAGSGRR